MNGQKILCVDSDSESLDTTVDVLRESIEEAKILQESSIDEALAVLETHSLDCIVTEYDLADATGLELARSVRELQPDVSCILFTGTPHSGIDTESYEDILIDYVDKSPTDALDRLVEVVRTTIQAQSHRAYPLPPDESGRLKILSKLDENQESLQDAVDRITKIATLHFDLPVASVNLIHDHVQEFVVCHGADWDQTPREESICTYTILEDDLTVIEDVEEDPRFADVEKLAELGIRFYAGAPLTIAGGGAIGTLCLYDRKPRTFGEGDRQFLQLLAEDVIEHIERYLQLMGRESAEGSERGGGP